MTDREIEINNALNIWARSTGRETIIQSVKDAFLAGYEYADSKREEIRIRCEEIIKEKDFAFKSTQELSESRRLACIDLLRENKELREVLKECQLQLEYLDKKFQSTGTTQAILSRIKDALK